MKHRRRAVSHHRHPHSFFLMSSHVELTQNTICPSFPLKHTLFSLSGSLCLSVSHTHTHPVPFGSLPLVFSCCWHDLYPNWPPSLIQKLSLVVSTAVLKSFCDTSNLQSFLHFSTFIITAKLRLTVNHSPCCKILYFAWPLDSSLPASPDGLPLCSPSLCRPDRSAGRSATWVWCGVYARYGLSPAPLSLSLPASSAWLFCSLMFHWPIKALFWLTK